MSRNPFQLCLLDSFVLFRTKKGNSTCQTLQVPHSENKACIAVFLMLFSFFKYQYNISTNHMYSVTLIQYPLWTVIMLHRAGVIRRVWWAYREEHNTYLLSEYCLKLCSLNASRYNHQTVLLFYTLPGYSRTKQITCCLLAVFTDQQFN